MVRLTGVWKVYGAVRAVQGISLDIPAGQVVGILGPNGAGKTTTIRMIAGLLPPTAGNATLDGLDTITHSRAVRQRLGYLPESTPLYPEMRVEDYLIYRAALYGLTRRERRAAAGRVIDRCRLTDVRRRAIGRLSKGYRQRTGLAAALIHDPKVLILDEPTSGLDPAQVIETRGLIRDLAGQRTTLVVSHLLPEVERTCDRIVIFARGRIVADGDPAALVAAGAGPRVVIAEVNAAEPQLRAALAGVAGLASLRVSGAEGGWSRLAASFVPGTPGDPRESIARGCSGSGLIVRELRAQTGSLEELYIRLVEREQTTPAEAGA